ncbi:MAG: VWA domain-containing protein [Bacteroidales bacterium]
MNNITFANPHFLWLLVIIPFLIYWFIAKEKKTHSFMHFSHCGFKTEIRKTWKRRMYPLLYVLRILAIISIIVALARPQSKMKNSTQNIEGIDIVMAMDISGSMLAEDFHPNRLESAKEVAKEFIQARENDRIAVVAFSGEAYTQCPLTIDKDILTNRLKELKSGLIADGTALGDGLAVSLNRVRNSNTKSKIIILLTDGVNNMGSIDPLSAADMANLYGIRIYTIGVGTIGTAPYPYQTPFGIQYQNVEVQIDETLLDNIAQNTGGKYFRATNQDKLKKIFSEIDQLEKTKIEVMSFEHSSEEYKPLLWIALLFLGLELICRMFVFKTLP